MERNRALDAVASLEQKQRRLEHYEGHLKISDRSKAHVVAVKDLIQPRLRWKWKVYLPSDKRYRLHWTDFDIPADGKITAEHNESGRTYGGATEYSGEFVVEFSVHMGYDGKWWMHLAADDQGLMTGDWGYWNDADIEFPMDPKKFPLNFNDRYSTLPKHGTRVVDGDVLLLHAMYPKVEGEGYPPGCAEGFAVWFEELAETDTSTTEPNE